MIRFAVLTLFPEFFETPLKSSLVGKAIEKGIVAVETINIRDYSQDKHRKTDDVPYGGGAGMVMMVAPIDRAVSELRQQNDLHVVLTSARGRQYSQEKAVELNRIVNSGKTLVIICGHYEGVDERVADFIADESISIGSYILSGGEIAALALLDSVSRLQAGFMGNPESILEESFSREGFLEFPQYTRPADYNGWKVPDILLSGHHENIRRWREEKSRLRESGIKPPKVEF